MNEKLNSVRRKLKALVVATLFGAVASAANADVLYSQRTFDGAAGIFSNMSAGAQNADSFTVGGAVNVDSLRWWGSYLSTDSDDFVVRLFSDNSGTPGGLLREYVGITVSKVDSGLKDSGQGEVFQYDYDLQDFVLGSGKYYLSIMNETLNSEWFWSVGNPGDGSSLARGTDNDQWSNPAPDSDIAFEVMGTRQPQAVPEPKSAALVMLAGISMVLARRKYRLKPI